MMPKRVKDRRSSLTPVMLEARHGIERRVHELRSFMSIDEVAADGRVI